MRKNDIIMSVSNLFPDIRQEGRKSPLTLFRTAIGTLPLPTKTHASPMDDGDHTSPAPESVSSPSAPSNTPGDPWASVFEGLPVPSKATLSNQYFSSRRQKAQVRGLAERTSPGPNFFTSSVPRSGGGRGTRGYVTISGFSRQKSTNINAWDQIFEGLDDPSALSSSRGRESAIFQSRPRKFPRKPMTASEISAFDNMFDMIFSATMEKRHSHTATVFAASASARARTETAKAEATTTTTSVPIAAVSAGGNMVQSNTMSDILNFDSSLQQQHPYYSGVGAQDIFLDGEADLDLDKEESEGLSDVFGWRGRTHSSRIRRTTEMDELFDKHKESIDLCTTDWELMEWAARVLFQEVIPADTILSSEESTEKQADTQAQSEIPSQPAAAASLEEAVSMQAQTHAEPPTQSSSSQPEEQQVQTNLQTQRPPIPPPIYPLLLSHLMYKMRVTHRNPHASLALFKHAKQLSIASYVFGCTAPAYNELLRARWAIEGLGTAAGDCDGLKGIENTLREMKANGVEFNSSTRAFVEDVRREVGRVEGINGYEKGSRDDDKLETTVLDPSWGLDAEGEMAWEVMMRIEEVIASSKRRRRGKHGVVGAVRDGGEAEARTVKEREGKTEARRKHWEESWKTGGGEAELAIGEEDSLSLK